MMEYFHTKLKWDFYESPPTNKEIDFIEEKIDIRFPRDFIACVKDYNEGSPSPRIFDCKSQFDGKNIETSFGGLMSFNPEDIEYILQSYKVLRSEHSQDLIVPFAADAGGNLICFDYRETKENPPVVYWEHEAYPPEKAITYLAPTFTDFLKMLR